MKKVKIEIVPYNPAWPAEFHEIGKQIRNAVGHAALTIHHMGSTLADGISQGGAGPDQFRTAPLWGLGQRIFFLHDGRTNDLLQAILAHSSSGNDCVTTQSVGQPFSQSQTCGSEANQVIEAFTDLSNSQKQDILNFLRSL